jgi:alcohol dehydrogenase
LRVPKSCRSPAMRPQVSFVRCRGERTIWQEEKIVEEFESARRLVEEFKGARYRFGNGVLPEAGGIIAALGKRAMLVRSGFAGIEGPVETLRRALAAAGVQLVAEVRGAAPNTPRRDVLRIADEIRRVEPDVIVSFGGGSTIDATKAAEILRSLGGRIEDYFGMGLVTKKLQVRSVPARASNSAPTGCKSRDLSPDPALQSSPGARDASGEMPHGIPTNALTPHVAIQTAAGSAAHLTKYANVTDGTQTGPETPTVESGSGPPQKKLIVDEAIVPARPVFDYTLTHHAPPALTADGALDGLAHILEVFYGAVGQPHYDRLRQIAQTGISLIVSCLPQVLAEPRDAVAREGLCLATDLGGYAIMRGGTNGGHLTSFSLVDILSHGRACAVMNPYYTVFFAPAIEDPLRVVGEVFRNVGYIKQDLAPLRGRDLGLAAANGMFAFARAIGFPTTLGEVSGFTRGHIDRALAAAKNPQLRMKLENMPIPMTAEKVEATMGPILEAAATGEVSRIRDLPVA